MMKIKLLQIKKLSDNKFSTHKNKYAAWSFTKKEPVQAIIKSEPDGSKRSLPTMDPGYHRGE